MNPKPVFHIYPNHQPAVLKQLGADAVHTRKFNTVKAYSIGGGKFHDMKVLAAKGGSTVVAFATDKMPVGRSVCDPSDAFNRKVGYYRAVEASIIQFWMNYAGGEYPSTQKEKDYLIESFYELWGAGDWAL